MRHYTLYWWMALAMLTWAIAWTNAKIVNEYLSFYNLVFFRFLFGSICLMPFTVKYKKKISLKILFNKYVLSASILFFIYNISFFHGTHYGYAGQGAVFVTTINPIITVLIISCIDKKINIQELGGIMLGFLGGLIIMDVFNQGLMLFNNNIYFLICAVTWGIMTVVISYGQKNMPALLFIFLSYTLTTLISFPFTKFSSIEFINLNAKFYINFFLVSVGAMSFGTSVYMYATSIIGPVKSSAFIYSVPFVALAFAAIILGEPIKMNVVIGGILSLVAIYVVNKK